MDIKEKRKQKKLTQVDLAKAIGVHLNTYVLWERGVSNPSPENLVKLKSVLGIKGELCGNLE